MAKSAFPIIVPEVSGIEPDCARSRRKNPSFVQVSRLNAGSEALF